MTWGVKKKFPCNTCPAEFDSRSKLRAHQKEAHPEDQNVVKGVDSLFDEDGMLKNKS